MRYFCWSQMLSPKFPSPILDATLSDRLLLAGLSERGLLGWGFGGRDMGENMALRPKKGVDRTISFLKGFLLAMINIYI